jgi:hypothetical protein
VGRGGAGGEFFSTTQKERRKNSDSHEVFFPPFFEIKLKILQSIKNSDHLILNLFADPCQCTYFRNLGRKKKRKKKKCL